MSLGFCFLIHTLNNRVSPQLVILWLRFAGCSTVQWLRKAMHTRQNQFFIPIKVYLFLLVFLAQAAQAQPSIGVLEKEGKKRNYLVFFGHSNKALLHTLNQRFSYRQLLLDSFNQAPQFATKVAQYPRYSTSYLEQRYEDQKEGTHRLGIASIDCQVVCNNEGILSIVRSISPEGNNKITNSVVSAYPYEHPQVFNLLNGKEWTKLPDFLNSNGVRFVLNALKKTMIYRASRCCPDERPKEYCRMAGYYRDYFKQIRYGVSNASAKTGVYRYDDQDKTEYFYFYFDKLGLTLSENSINIARVNCIAPNPLLHIPYAALLPYCIASAQNPVYLKAQKDAKNRPEKRVIAAKAYIKNELVDEVTKTTPYLVKNDRVRVLTTEGDQVQVYYLSPFGMVFNGWVAKKDLE